MFIKHYSGKYCWRATDVCTPVDYIPNPAPSPVQEIIIDSLWFPSVRNMSNDNIMEYATAFAHLELQCMRSASPEAQPLSMISQTSARGGTRRAKIPSPGEGESYSSLGDTWISRLKRKKPNTI